MSNGNEVVLSFVSGQCSLIEKIAFPDPWKVHWQMSGREVRYGILQRPYREGRERERESLLRTEAAVSVLQICNTWQDTSRNRSVWIVVNLSFVLGSTTLHVRDRKKQAEVSEVDFHLIVWANNRIWANLDQNLISDELYVKSTHIKLNHIFLM